MAGALALVGARRLFLCALPNMDRTRPSAVMDWGVPAIRSPMSAQSGSNPFLGRSDLPFELPPFDLILAEHFAPAFDAGMAEHRAQIDAIIANPEPPTFENTIVALERAGQLLSRTSLVFFNLAGTDSTEALRAIESEYAPRLTTHDDAIRLDPRLFARVKDVFESFAAP